MTDTNRAAAEEAAAAAATAYALRERQGPGDTASETLVTIDPLLSDEIIRSRVQALEALRLYARLLIDLSDGSLSASLAQEVEGLGGDVDNLIASASEAGVVPENIGKFKFKPLSTALAAIAESMIEAKAARSISEVAPKVQPVLVDLVAEMQRDIDIMDEILIGRAGDLKASLEAVLAADASRSAPMRFAQHRSFAAELRTFESRRAALARLRSALAALPAAHAAIADPAQADSGAAVGTFLRFAELAADLYTTNFGD
ncbi:MAG: hypothetical protein AAGA70_18180 [Pseudomonadota bacterium]